MNAGAAGARWPFPGVVWGDYPEQPVVQAAGRRGRGRGLKSCRAFAAQVLATPTVSADELPRRLAALHSAAARQDPESWLLEAFVLAASAMAQTLGFKPYQQQLTAARLLLEERLVEMATGEGKTAAIALAAAVAGLGRTPVHVVTANDYLAQRDARLQQAFYELLGLRAGFIDQPMGAAVRRAAYRADVVYCTAKELVFDYLRDGLSRTSDLSPLERRARRLGAAVTGEPPVLRGLCMAIIDEADTVLIDEAGVPLVLSQPEGAAGEAQFHGDALALARQMRDGLDFRSASAGRRLQLTSAGQTRLQQWPAAPHPLYGHGRHREAAVLLGLTALHMLERDRDYVVRDGRVAPIDGTTGRAAPGRAWSHGLHQLLELKEGLQATVRSATVAQITFQRFFPRYLRLAGMSGTLKGSAGELRAIYGLGVTVLPPRTPRRVNQLPYRLFHDSARLWEAVAASARIVQASGRPVLIGTNSVAQSEALSRVLTVQGLEHQVLNARQDSAESRVIATAGQTGRITVATSMAGRGTDIILEQPVAAWGGLHVLLCQHNASARIDRQFLGRAGRHGQPGSTQVMQALDFPLLQRWLPPWWRGMLRRSGISSLLARPSAQLAQTLEGFTQTQQRVTLCKDTAREDRELTFSRRNLP